MQLTYQACVRGAKRPRKEMLESPEKKSESEELLTSVLSMHIKRPWRGTTTSGYTHTEVYRARKFDPDIFEGGLSSVVACTCTEQSFHWGTVDLAIAMSSDKRHLNNSPNGQSHMWGYKTLQVRQATLGYSKELYR